MATMSPEHIDTFLAETRIAKLATLNADGSPNVVPVWFEWADGEARVFTSRGSAKVKRLERDARCAVSVEEGVGVPEAWVTVEGVATVDDVGTWELVERLAHRYYDPEKAAATLVEWERGRANWVTIRLKPTRIRSSV